ncbi:MAG TPA: MauE/DoxX family redox-associated membrane protein [Solirubrobacteraceae bacterium]|jgi:uncharacterized membrane protein YhaH (DUF805 family)
MPSIDFPDPGAAQDLAYALQLLLGVVFTASVAPKLRRPDEFRRVVAGYDVAPRWASVVAPAVIAVEAVLALAFLSGSLVGAALAVALVLIAVFALATGVNLRRGRRIDCGCFGGPGEQISARSLFRLGALALAVAVLAIGMLTDAIAPTTVGWLASHGVASLAYVVATLGLSVFFIVVCVWAMHAKELAFVFGRGGRGA